MSARWEKYAQSDTGLKLVAAIDKPEREIEYRLLSRLKMAAVYAIVHDVKPVFELLDAKDKRDEASQFCGWFVAQHMRRLGFTISDARGRVKDAPFSTGAIWHLEEGEEK